MSDTPRTDAMCWDEDATFVNVIFARQLERELTALRAQVEGLENKCALLAASWKKAEDELEKARAAQSKTSR
jgi:hypothetical protein